jgi:hypothetical protein
LWIHARIISVRGRPQPTRRHHGAEYGV